MIVEDESEIRGQAVDFSESLTDDEDPFRIIVETMAEGALTLSQEGKVLHCNPALAKILGRPLTEVLGAHFAGWVSEDYQDTYAALLANAAERCRGELRLVRADGASVLVQLATSPLHRADMARAICMTVADRTEHERRLALEIEQQAARAREKLLLECQQGLDRLNLELMNTNREIKDLCAGLNEKARRLQDADAIKTRLLLRMNHEIRSPLNSIFALTSLLLRRADGELGGEQGKLLGYIRKAADSVLDLLNDSLDLARIESGDIEVHPAPFEAAESLDTLRGLLPESLVTPTVRLVFEEPGDIPTLCSDESKVLQILRNFVNNALKFTERGEVRVGARYDHENDMVYYSVRDTGVGIAPEDQRKIFDELNVVKGRPPGESKGTGLGLPLCLRLASLLRGRVMIESELGAGSNFLLALPRRFAPGAREIAGDDQSAGFPRAESVDAVAGSSLA
ncbi:MAG: ATP-binding protein [Candidatus Binatia bacterium]